VQLRLRGSSSHGCSRRILLRCVERLSSRTGMIQLGSRCSQLRSCCCMCQAGIMSARRSPSGSTHPLGTVYNATPPRDPYCLSTCRPDMLAVSSKLPDKSGRASM
jgi:hypothetical protein